ncbi:small, acid-soluble spore protein, alpha/beta type [Paenibacillus hamazuiensis]|uniref:small, acid-soluble spore protein, alpha/beta type n=1 Tax=Paenibacillus hamazuiensis TaxID=2936508 RepID=UPI0023DFD30F|nr:small, acid-soluble spore protein, alpha/beta type [Paenibacillus hamazuiensis]
MGRRNRRGVMSESFKYELAKDLGFYDTIQKDGWGGIRTKDAGNMVKRAIQIAEQAAKQQYGQQTPAGGFQSTQTPYGAAAQQSPQQGGYVARQPAGQQGYSRQTALYNGQTQPQPQYPRI